jgi:hypothetical protein
MISDIFSILVVFISRIFAKCFLFIALSIGTPTINAMRSIEERDAIVIVLDKSHRTHERGLIRAFGYKPEYRFVLYGGISENFFSPIS